MKNYTKAIAIAGMAYAVVAGAAQAGTIDDGNWYAGASGDLTWLRHSDTGAGLNVDLGYRVAPDLRVEGEIGYHNASGSGSYGDAYYFTYMANGYYDFNQFTLAPSAGWRVVPYLGAGLGVAQYRFGESNFANTFHHHDTDFAYQGMAGVTVAADSMPNTDVVFGYRYVGAGGADASDLSANNIELGFRYHF